MNIRNIIIACCIALLTTEGAIAQENMSLSLEQCRKMALEYSEDLKQADNKMHQAELDKKIATTAFLPKFDASATGIYMFPDLDMMGMEMRMRGTYMAGITLTQPLYAGGKILTGRKMSRIGEEAANEQYRMTRMDVLVETDNAYWSYIAVNRKVKMLESYCAQMDTIYRQIEAALSAGMATENDLLRIDAEHSNITYQLQKARNGADLCRMALCRIIGVGYETLITPTDTLLSISHPGQLSGDISDRPELHLLEKQVDVNKQQIKMARADMLPTLGLSVGYTYYGNIKLNSMVDAGNGTMVHTQEFKDGIGLAMVALQIPILHWGENFKKVRKARYELQNSQLQLQKNSRLLDLEVQQAIRNLQDAYMLIGTAQKGLQQANENLRVMRNRYAASMATLTDLLDVQSQWQQAESNYIEAQTQYKMCETEYLRATGHLE
ncbi:MAG: TolC family protein [Coprobacter sp.]|nr:TolC family protein [Coprobacter sp.]